MIVIHVLANMYDVSYIFVKNMWYAKQNQLGVIKTCCQVSKIISLTGKIKNWYQVAAK